MFVLASEGEGGVSLLVGCGVLVRRHDLRVLDRSAGLLAGKRGRRIGVVVSASPSSDPASSASYSCCCESTSASLTSGSKSGLYLPSPVSVVSSF